MITESFSKRVWLGVLCRTGSRRFTHTTQGSTTQGSTTKLQEPWPGSQSVMQTHNSQQARDKGMDKSPATRG